MYAPAALSSLASCGSTRLNRVVTFFALSLGTCEPQLLHEMTDELPFPPFDRPRLFLFFVILRYCREGFLKRLGTVDGFALESQPTMASTSISTIMRGSIRPETSTIAVAGFVSPKNSLCAFPISFHFEMSVV
jgi:hypothetical protein